MADCLSRRLCIVNRKPSPYRVTDDDVNRWHHYILDITDNASTSVCRILVTPRVHRHLILYDPTKLGGPWYWDLANDEHYCLHRVLGYDGAERSLVTEFWRESEFVGLTVPAPDRSVISDIEFIKPATSRTANGDIDDAELHVLSWFHSQSECSLLGSQSIRMFSPGFTVNQNVLSWVHSQPDKFMRSLEGVKDLAKTRLQLALQEALTQLPSITKHFDQTFEANTIYAHNDAVASLAAHSPPRGTLCNEVQISSS
ncbi:uncharacterized protein LOC110040197 isoform X2 [Orbicella faveolata]|uniref:uncharacterized protein LOC110040197 isoform X2 n=1 Tax=Orbicella faveolata TaxID=48498 RepID=UPI0009E5453A|nr:uncharacterized protein LOC110040197 isoform X2 [Orbicella faveolata]